MSLETAEPGRRRGAVVILGALQILAWGSSFYLLGVLAGPIAADTGWPPSFVVGGLSIALLIAGLASPRVGRAIQAHGGRPVLAASSLLFAAGLGCLAAAPALPVYLFGWAVLGLAMACGLYDPAFATLGRHYGHAARRMITFVTLFGGFASTVSWPATAWLLETHGWRAASWTYAAIHIGVGAPLYWFCLPRRPPALEAMPPAPASTIPELPLERQPTAFALLGLILTIGSVTLSMMSMHLLTLLQARGLDLAAAVALGALIGPSQVAARIVDMAAGRRFHPLWAMLSGVVLVAIGVLLLWAGFPLVALALIAYGAGNGISSIVRGTVPLVLFGPARYAPLMGRLGLPILIGMAIAPTLGAVLIDRGGAALAFGVMAGASVLNVGLTIGLGWWCWRAVARR
ncbi:Major Facilitator Superfamily protein [bacterium YEK0313]|nr:Major Facilitator Superfamily protein [bacterium YEK0313]